MPRSSSPWTNSDRKLKLIKNNLSSKGQQLQANNMNKSKMQEYKDSSKNDIKNQEPNTAKQSKDRNVNFYNFMAEKAFFPWTKPKVRLEQVVQENDNEQSCSKSLSSSWKNPNANPYNNGKNFIKFNIESLKPKEDSHRHHQSRLSSSDSETPNKMKKSSCKKQNNKEYYTASMEQNNKECTTDDLKFVSYLPRPSPVLDSMFFLPTSANVANNNRNNNMPLNLSQFSPQHSAAESNDTSPAYINNVWTHIMQTVESVINDTLQQYCSQTSDKMKEIYHRVEKNEAQLYQLYNEFEERMRQLNENYLKHYQAILEFIKQNDAHQKDEQFNYVSTPKVRKINSAEQLCSTNERIAGGNTRDEISERNILKDNKSNKSNMEKTSKPTSYNSSKVDKGSNTSDTMLNVRAHDDDVQRILNSKKHESRKNRQSSVSTSKNVAEQTNLNEGSDLRDNKTPTPRPRHKCCCNHNECHIMTSSICDKYGFIDRNRQLLNAQQNQYTLQIKVKENENEEETR